MTFWVLTLNAVNFTLYAELCYSFSNKSSFLLVIYNDLLSNMELLIAVVFDLWPCRYCRKLLCALIEGENWEPFILHNLKLERRIAIRIEKLPENPILICFSQPCGKSCFCVYQMKFFGWESKSHPCACRFSLKIKPGHGWWLHWFWAPTPCTSKRQIMHSKRYLAVWNRVVMLRFSVRSCKDSSLWAVFLLAVFRIEACWDFSFEYEYLPGSTAVVCTS